MHELLQLQQDRKATRAQHVPSTDSPHASSEKTGAWNSLVLPCPSPNANLTEVAG